MMMVMIYESMHLQKKEAIVKTKNNLIALVYIHLYVWACLMEK